MSSLQERIQILLAKQYSDPNREMIKRAVELAMRSGRSEDEVVILLGEALVEIEDQKGPAQLPVIVAKMLASMYLVATREGFDLNSYLESYLFYEESRFQTEAEPRPDGKSRRLFR